MHGSERKAAQPSSPPPSLLLLQPVGCTFRSFGPFFGPIQSGLFLLIVFFFSLSYPFMYVFSVFFEFLAHSCFFFSNVGFCFFSVFLFDFLLYFESLRF